MKKDFEKIINPSYLQYVNKLQKGYSLPIAVALGLNFKDSPAIKLLNNMKNIQPQIQNNNFAFLSKIDPSLMSIMKEIASSRFPFKLKDMMRLSEMIDPISHKYLSIIKHHDKTLAKLLRPENHTLFDLLANLKNLPSIDTILSDSDMDISDITHFDEPSLSEVGSKASEEISSTDDFNLLSDKIKKFIIILLIFLCTKSCEVTTNIISSRLENALFDTNEKSTNLSTKSELKKFIKSLSYEDDRLILKVFNYRITNVSSLNLRVRPNTKSEVISVLPIGSLVKIIDSSSNKSWISVKVKIDNEIKTGWILRRYTTYFK